jgi:hypothetical protein
MVDTISAHRSSAFCKFKLFQIMGQPVFFCDQELADDSSGVGRYVILVQETEIKVDICMGDVPVHDATPLQVDPSPTEL